MVNETTMLRWLRWRYKISLTELALAAHVSNQQTSRAELLQLPITPELECKFDSALETVITRRRNDLRALEHDFQKVKGNLLKKMED